MGKLPLLWKILYMIMEDGKIVFSIQISEFQL